MEIHRWDGVYGSISDGGVHACRVLKPPRCTWYDAESDGTYDCIFDTDGGVLVDQGMELSGKKYKGTAAERMKPAPIDECQITTRLRYIDNWGEEEVRPENVWSPYGYVSEFRFHDHDNQTNGRLLRNDGTFKIAMSYPGHKAEMEQDKAEVEENSDEPSSPSSKEKVSVINFHHFSNIFFLPSQLTPAFFYLQYSPWRKVVP